ncbi:MAG: formate/nitrite transporter family protein [Eubacteriales bacterium]|nr:formate/nitrite transporter family protein [Eubacteriales bacterium]
MQAPAQIAATYVTVGTNKAKLPAAKMFVLAVFAGIFIAIAGASAAVASATISDPSTARLLNALIFPGGLVMVVLAGSELFTGNSLLLIPLLEKKIRIHELLRSWIVVYLGNLCGSLFVAFLFVYSHTAGLFDGQLAQSLVNTAVAKTSLSFSDAFLRGILCNILVCIAVWITIGASTAAGKVFGLYLPIVVFVLAGYEHCVANMFYIPAGIFSVAEYGLTAEGLSWASFFLRNLLPVTFGNILGGFLVGGGYWFAYLHQTSHKKVHP